MSFFSFLICSSLGNIRRNDLFHNCIYTLTTERQKTTLEASGKKKTIGWMQRGGSRRRHKIIKFQKNSLNIPPIDIQRTQTFYDTIHAKMYSNRLCHCIYMIAQSMLLFPDHILAALHSL